MGDDNVGVSGPFENAYYTFCRGGVIPLVIGAYGETNEDFQDVLKVCARMAVARGDAVYNSPIFETEVKGGAYSVTLHLYRRAIAGAIARGLFLHKRRGCISYVVQERRQLGLPRKRRFTLRLADALVVMDSRLVTQVENMAAMSNLEALEVDLNGTMSNSLRKSLLLCLTFFTFPCLVMSILNTFMQ